MKSTRLLPALLALTGAMLIAAAIFVWNEARKEIIFLCANFTAGVPEESVIRQLKTGNFLRFRRETRSLGSRVVVDSAYNLGVYICLIELGPDGNVIRSYVDTPIMKL